MSHGSPRVALRSVVAAKVSRRRRVAVHASRSLDIATESVLMHGVVRTARLPDFCRADDPSALRAAVGIIMLHMHRAPD